MTASTFQENVSKLEFSLKQDSQSGVIFTHNYLAGRDISAHELFALELARDKFQADAVYFRWFNDSRESVAQVYLYDFTHTPITAQIRRDIHRKIWSGCQVPLYIIVERSEVKIFDARQNVEEHQDHALRTIQLTGQAIKEFSATHFDDGLFWGETEQKGAFQYSTSAYKDLVSGLKEVYRDFQKRSSLTSDVALKLLVQCLLIKYLEERDDQNRTGYFSKKYFQRNFLCTNFCDVIREGKLLELLDHLASDFNGKIFDWNDETEGFERVVVQNTDLRMMADYLDGHVQNNRQFVIWRLYSFSHLPVELISSVYEELLTDSKDIVYTPEIVVSLLVDECMPLRSPKSDFRVIDVSCGSGIFLVKAYKRIIQWWRYQQYVDSQDRNLVKPDLATLKSLLKRSIYGVDVKRDAIRLSVFSLALALLDEVDLSPPVWQNLKFPDLGESNIINTDFFEFVSRPNTQTFELVIGNPPFNPFIKGQSNGEYASFLYQQYGYRSELVIPDNNPALHFLTRAMKLVEKDGLLCMIQPSGPLLYQKSKTFREFIFRQWNLLQVIDLTQLADVLWGKKNVATAAVFFQNCDSESDQILHIVASRRESNRKRLFLEFDHYDLHWVSKQDAIENFYCWKANLLGGGRRLLALINRLSQFPTLGDFLKIKTSGEKPWKVGQGFIKSKSDEYFESNYSAEELNNRYRADYLTGHECFEPANFDEEGVHETYTIEGKYFLWRRNPEIFKAPLLLIKENIGKRSIPVLYFTSDIAYHDEVTGIHAPIEDAEELEKLGKQLKGNQLLRFYSLLTSGRAGVSRSTSTLLQKDLLNLPYCEQEIKLTDAEKIVFNDILDYQLNARPSVLDAPSTESDVEDYSKVFCQTLNTIYATSGNHFRLFKVLDAGRYFALHFRFSDDSKSYTIDQVSDLERYIESAINASRTNNTHNYQRILKIYGSNTIILVKPKARRYWLQSIALRDADESFEDYLKAGF